MHALWLLTLHTGIFLAVAVTLCASLTLCDWCKQRLARWWRTPSATSRGAMAAAACPPHQRLALGASASAASGSARSIPFSRSPARDRTWR